MPSKSAKSQRKPMEKNPKPRSKTKKQKTIQGRLEQLKSKLEKEQPTPVQASNTAKSKAAKRKGLAPIPFSNLGRWLVHTIHATFGDDKDTVRQLVYGLRMHVNEHRKLLNEQRQHLGLNEVLEKVLPEHLYQLIRRMMQLFSYREMVYVKGTEDLNKYLNLMMQRSKTVATELSAQEKKLNKILDEWTAELEKDRDLLVSRVRQSADCENPVSRSIFGVQRPDSTPQMNHLLKEGKSLFGKIEELRKHRVDAVLNGDRALVREIEKHLRDALSKAHAISGARQYFYTAHDSDELLRFSTSSERLKEDLVGLLTLPKLYFNDYELAAHQFQSTIDENIGGMRLFAKMRLTQEFMQAAKELEEELCSQIEIIFSKIQEELRLLDSEVELLNTEFLAEFARARLDEDLRDQVARYIKSMYIASDCKIARLNEQFLALASNPLKRSVSKVKSAPPREPASPAAAGQKVPQAVPVSEFDGGTGRTSISGDSSSDEGSYTEE